MAALATPPADHMEAIATSLAAAMQAAPPPLVLDAVVPVLDAPTLAAEPVAAPIVEVPTEPAPLDLESIDFDAPTSEDAALPEIKTPATTPDSELAKTLEQMLADPNVVPEQIESIFLKTTKGRTMLSNYKMLRELTKPPEMDAEGKEIGGIGRIPTIEEIRRADSALRDVETMKFEAGENPASFVANLFTFQQDGKSYIGDPQQTARVLETIPAVLIESIQSADPQHAGMYQGLMAAYIAPVFQQFFNNQYKQALAMPDATKEQQDDKYRVLDALQISEFKAFGAARPLNLRQQGGANGAPAAPDPEKAALQARLRQYEQNSQQQQRQQRQSVAQNVENQAQEAGRKAVDVVLTQTGVRKAYDALIADGQQAEIMRDVHNGLPNANPSGWNAYQIQVQQAVAGRLDPAVPVQTYTKMVQNALRTLPAVRDRITKLVGTAKVNSDAQHTAAAQSQMRTEPNGMGAPAPQPVVSAGVSPRQPGESQVEYIARTFASSMPR